MLKRMDLDFKPPPGSLATEDEQEGGELDYSQYYPTLLPLRPPAEEASAMRSLDAAVAEPDPTVRPPQSKGCPHEPVLKRDMAAFSSVARQHT